MLLRIFCAFVLPFGENPDEFYFFERVWAEASRLKDPNFFYGYPINFPNNEYFYPPFYFFILSKTLFLFGGADYSLKESFFNFALSFRFLAVFISLIQLLLVLKILQGLRLPSVISILVPSILGFLPSYVTFSSYMNPNLWLVTLIMLFIYFTINFSKKIYKVLVLGVLAGLASITKFEGVILLFCFPYYLFINKFKLDILLKYSLIFSVASIIGGVWWYLKNLLNYGWFYDKELFSASVSLNNLPFSFNGYLQRLISWTFESFVLTYGSTNNIRIAPIGYLLTFLILIFAIYGLIRGGLKLVKRNKSFGRFYCLMIVLFFLNLLVFVLLNVTLVFQPQGRYLYPSIFFIALSISIGLYEVFKSMNNLLKFLPLGVLCFLIALNFWGISCLSKFYYKIDLGFNLLGCVFYR